MIPALAPLFDKMTTWQVSQRFTAEEALRFFEDEVSHPSEVVLQMPQTVCVDWETMSDSNRYWSKLSPQSQKEWSHLRTPAWPLWMRGLQWIIAHVPRGWQVVVFVRSFLQI